MFFLQDFWDWSWQELALYDLTDMISYINSITNTKIFVVGHSQVLHLFFYLILLLPFGCLVSYKLNLFSFFSGYNHVFGCFHSARYSGNG
jgi:hypothetical protein